MFHNTAVSSADNQYQQIYEFVTSIPSNTALAYWIEDTSGNYKHTVYVTHKVAEIGMGITRPSILPVWAARRSDEWGTGYPTSADPLPDTVTSATPGAGTFKWEWNVPSSLAPGNYYYYVEVNLPWDDNAYYTDSTRGQPSVVFRGSLKVDSESTVTTGAVVGHGHETGANGNLATTIDSLTTALNIISSVSVNHYLAPSITTTTLPDADAGSAYTASVAFKDKNSGDSHAFSLLNSPAWMSINNSGVISGTPGSGDAGSDVAVTVRIVDSSDLADTLSTTIDVVSSNSPPVISTATLPDATEGQAYSATVSATDPDTDTVTFSLLTGPSWLSITSGGALSGTPSDSDVGSNIAISVRAADPVGLADTLSTTIDVLNTNDPPVISTTSLPDATEGQAYSATVSATDPDTDTVTFSLLTGPSWLSITSGGALSGTPSDSDVGSNIAISVRAADPGGLADTLSTTIDVLNVNDAPVISTTSLPDATEDQAYSATVSATDPDTDTVTFSLLTGPAWLSITSGGVLSGTPTNSDVGTNIAVSVRASDPGGLADTFSTTIDVLNTNDPPVISTATLPDAAKDQAYNTTVSATDPDTDAVTFSLITGPAWLSVTPAGVVSGTPSSSDVGTDIPVLVRAADSGGLADTLSTTIDVVSYNDPPVISTTALPDAVEDQAYSTTVSATDPDADAITFTLLNGPEWLSITTGGVLSGTPTDSNVGTNFAVDVRAADPSGLADTLRTFIDVANVNDPPVISTATLPDAAKDQAYNTAVSATDPDGNTVTFSLLNGPEWLSITSGGVLSGTPSSSDVGSDITVSVRAADPGGLADTLNTTIDVLNANDPPVISTATLPEATEDQAYSTTVSATDPDTDAIIFSLLNGPEWLSITAGGILSGTPLNSDAGTGISVSVRAADSGDLADTLSTTIAVINTNDAPRILSSTIPNGAQNVAYSGQLDVIDPDSSDVLTYSLLSGPGWMSIDSATGALSGTPTPADVGNNISVSVKVTDNSNASDEAVFTINVVALNTSPVIVTTDIPDGVENTVYSATIEATDSDSNDTLTFFLLSVPDWLSIDSSTGVLSGTPLNNDVGTGIEISVMVADNGTPSLSDTLTVSITVINTNDAPDIVTESISNAKLDVEYSMLIEADDPDVGDVLTYEIISGPEWLTIDSATGQLSGIPGTDDVGSEISVAVRVSDVSGADDEVTYVFSVINTSSAAAVEVNDSGGEYNVNNVRGLVELGLEELSVLIPAGAVESQQNIVIEIPESVSEMGVAFTVVSFTVDGHEGQYDFAQPVTIRIPYSDDVENEELLTIKQWDPDTNKWKTIDLSLSIEIDTDQNVIIAQVSHFSIYGVVYENESTRVDTEVPTGIVLMPPYPNPSNSNVAFQFTLPDEYAVRLSVYDILGREIALLENRRISSGIYVRSWNGKDKNNAAVSNGVYLYMFRAGSYISKGKLLYLK